MATYELYHAAKVEHARGIVHPPQPLRDSVFTPFSSSLPTTVSGPLPKGLYTAKWLKLARRSGGSVAIICGYIVRGDGANRCSR